MQTNQTTLLPTHTPGMTGVLRASSGQGFLTIGNGFFEHWLWAEERTFSRVEAVIYLAASEGSFQTIHAISDRWRWCPNVVRGFLEALEADGCIRISRHLMDGVVVTMIGLPGDAAKERFSAVARRRPIAAKDRRKVLSAGKCSACGGIENLTVDHILPVSLGGTNHISNLRCLCSSCNSSRGNNIKWKYRAK